MEWANRHVLVTRALSDAAGWVAQLTARGIRASALPCVAAVRIADTATQMRLVDAICRAHGLIVTSARGAQCVAAAMPVLPLRLDVAVVGPATADAVHRLFGRTPYVARGATSRALGHELVAQWGGRVDNRHVVIAGAEGGRDDADTLLAGAGVHVTRVDVYRTTAALPTARRRDLAIEGVTDVLLASPSAVRGLLNLATVARATRLYAIGPTTSAEAAAAGLRVTAEAATPDLDSLIEAMQCVTPP